ncbi:MAG: PIN domain-containing protein [Cyanobacteria bacterium P01_F01_bin.3]
MKVLFDTNVLLDALLERQPFVKDAAFLIEATETGKIEGFISATTITDIHYLVRRQTKSTKVAIDAINGLLALMDVCAVNRSVLEQSLALGLPDFEDSVQVACAMSTGLNVIVTRDVKGFIGSPIPALTPDELKNRLA